jgi:hypothetical protein
METRQMVMYGLLLQIEAPVSVTSILITGITALSTVVIFQFYQNKALNKEIKSMAESFADKMREVYKEQIKDSREVVDKNTKAFHEHTSAVQENSELTRELKEAILDTQLEQTKALTELRLWLKENYGKPSRG